MMKKNKTITGVFCALIGAVLVLSAPSILRAFVNSSNSGFDKFWNQFCVAFANYLNVTNVAVSMMTAIAIQPVFILLRMICRALKANIAVVTLVCTIAGGAMIIATPSFMYAVSEAWSNGLAGFWANFGRAFVHYLNVGNVTIAMLIALIMQPAFKLTKWLCQKLIRN